eukprot:762665-Hanusia_phi.AAC.1
MVVHEDTKSEGGRGYGGKGKGGEGMDCQYLTELGGGSIEGGREGERGSRGHEGSKGNGSEHGVEGLVRGEQAFLVI